MAEQPIKLTAEILGKMTEQMLEAMPNVATMDKPTAAVVGTLTGLLVGVSELVERIEALESGDLLVKSIETLSPSAGDIVVVTLKGDLHGEEGRGFMNSVDQFMTTRLRGTGIRHMVIDERVANIQVIEAVPKRLDDVMHGPNCPCTDCT